MSPSRYSDVEPALVTGALLVGGKSGRMGRDKASLLVDGIPLAARPAAVLSSIASEVVLVGGAVPGVSGRVIADLVDDAGPLGGLAAVTRTARTPFVVAAACDSPTLVPSLLGLLLDRLRAAPQSGAAYCRSEAGVEPFPLALRSAVADELARLVGSSTRALHLALATLDPVVLEPAEWSRVDPTGASFVNWNRPEDVRQGAARPPTIRVDD